MNLYTTKSIGGIVKDIDVKNRVVTGYFASFDTLDSDGDVFQKGAFKKSISENTKRMMHLLQHDVMKPIGRPEVKEDNYGLFFKTEFTPTALNVKYIEDTLNLYEAGIYNEHSVGFQTVKQHQDRESKSNFITEVKLWEGSTVTWGANSNTPVQGIKSQFKTKQDIVEKIDTINKAIRKGNFADETFEQLELFNEQLKSLLLDEPSNDTQTTKNEPIYSDVELFAAMLSNKWKK